MKEYFAMCSWINDIYGWKCGWKITMDELFMNVDNKFFFCENWMKEIGWKKFSLVAHIHVDLSRGMCQFKH
jgi:hypothetical protein